MKVSIYVGGTRNSEGVRGCTSVFAGRDALEWLIPGWVVFVKLNGRAGHRFVNNEVRPVKILNDGQLTTVLMTRPYGSKEWKMLPRGSIESVHQNWYTWSYAQAEAEKVK